MCTSSTLIDWNRITLVAVSSIIDLTSAVITINQIDTDCVFITLSLASGTLINSFGNTIDTITNETILASTFESVLQIDTTGIGMTVIRTQITLVYVFECGTRSWFRS